MQMQYETTAALLSAAWGSLQDRTQPGAMFPGLVTLATNTPNGPDARSVVMRRFDPRAAAIDVHTDTATPKIKELEADKRVALVHWAQHRLLQVRILGTADILDDEAANAEWEEVAIATRLNYGVDPAPGSSINAPGEFSRVAQKTRFAVIRITVRQMDVVHLGEPYHIRARFNREDNWAGQWLAP